MTTIDETRAAEYAARESLALTISKILSEHEDPSLQRSTIIEMLARASSHLQEGETSA